MRWHRWRGLVRLEDGVSGTLRRISFSFIAKLCVFLHCSHTVFHVDIHYSLHRKTPVFCNFEVYHLVMLQNRYTVLDLLRYVINILVF
jgi:hypothetical protein